MGSEMCIRDSLYVSGCILSRIGRVASSGCFPTLFLRILALSRLYRFSSDLGINLVVVIGFVFISSQVGILAFPGSILISGLFIPWLSPSVRFLITARASAGTPLPMMLSGSSMMICSFFFFAKHPIWQYWFHLPHGTCFCSHS